MTQSYIICSCLAVLAFCNADYLSDIPALKEMMNNQELKEDLASMLEPRLADTDPKDMYTVLKAIQSQEQPAESDTVDSGDVSKRPFCNGFTGCGRFGKRRLRLIRQRFPIKVLSSQAVRVQEKDMQLSLNTYGDQTIAIECYDNLQPKIGRCRQCGRNGGRAGYSPDSSSSLCLFRFNTFKIHLCVLT
ncbi:hypothetical protein ScPMuIL_000027 [Solemya velum]